MNWRTHPPNGAGGDPVDRFLDDLAEAAERAPVGIPSPIAELDRRVHQRRSRRLRVRAAIAGGTVAVAAVGAGAWMALDGRRDPIDVVTDTSLHRTTTLAPTTTTVVIEPGALPAGWVLESDNTTPAGDPGRDGKATVLRTLEYRNSEGILVTVSIIRNYEADLEERIRLDGGRLDTVRGVDARVADEDLQLIEWNDPSGDFVQIASRQEPLASLREFAEQMRA